MPKDDNIEEKQIIQSETKTDKEEIESQPFKSEVGLTKKQKKELARDICDEIEKSIENSASFYSMLDRYNKLYDRVYLDNRETMGGSKVFIPISTYKLDGVVNKVAETINESDMIFNLTYTDRNETDLMKLSAINQLFQDILDNRLKFRTLQEQFLHNAGKQRTSIGALIWDKQIKRRTKLETYTSVEEFKREFPSAEKSGIDSKEYRKIISNIEKGSDDLQVKYNHVEQGAKLSIINREDFINVPADARDFDESVGKFMRTWYTWQDFEKGIKSGKYDKKDIDSLKAKEGRDRTEKDKEKRHDTEITQESEATGGLEASKKEVEGIHTEGRTGIECFVGIYRYDLDGDGIDEDVLVEVEYKSKHLLYINEYIYWSGNPYFQKWVFKQRVNRFDGISIIELLEHLNLELNTLHNQRNDYWNMVLSTTFLQDEEAEITPDPTEDGFELGRTYKITAPPGKNIEDTFKQMFKMVSGIPNFIQEEQQLLKYIDDITVSDQLLTGKESATDPNAPATKTLALMKMAVSKIAGYIRNLRSGYNQFAEDLMWLQYQFGKDEYIQFIDDQEIVITRQDLFPENFSYELTVTEKHMSQDVQRELAGVVVNQSLQFPMVEQNDISQQELLKYWLKKVQYEGDVEKIAMTGQELVDLLTANMVQQQQAEAQEQAQELAQEAEGIMSGMEPDEREGIIEEATEGIQ
jgi:hypothetical protein